MLSKILACCALVGVLAAQEAPSYLYRVPAPVSAGLMLQLHQHFDIAACEHAVGGGSATPVDVVVFADRLAAFRQMVPQATLVAEGRPFEEVHRDMLAAAAARGEDMPDPAYYTVAEIEAAIDAQVSANPAICQKVDVTAFPGAALTHDGRRIYALKVSDNVGQDENEPAVVIAAQHHARELNSPHMVIGAMQRVVAAYGSDPALTAAVDAKEIYFVPMVNPDGVNHCWTVDQWWRKNRRNNGSSYGVDLNRNFPFLWGDCGASTTPSSQIYRGPSAGSEPETRTMIAMMRAVRPEVYIDFHSSGREVLTLYPPCASVSSAVGSMDLTYRTDLRLPMSYATRSPSASGEAPHDHWAAGGALSYLVEISTSFQPSFSSTISEEARVWPGIERLLTTWEPALRGNVTSVFQSQPLEATVTYSPNQFSHGEVSMSRARDGRYGLWLPTGSWNVTWSAPGFQSRTELVQVTAYNQAQVQDVELEPIWAQATTQLTGTGQLGTPLTVTYTSPGDAGLTYFIGWSLGTAPGVPLGTRTLPLTYDFLFEAALVGNPILQNNWGTLSPLGQGVATLTVPNDPLTLGFQVFFAGATLDPDYVAGVKKFSQPVQVIVSQ